MKIRISFSINKVIELLLWLLFILNLGGGLFAPLYAVFVTGSIVGASLKTVGFAVAFYAVAKSLFQIPIARRIDRKEGERDDFFVMLTGAAIGVIYPLSLILISYPWQLYLVEIMNGVGGACLMAAYYAIFSRHVDKGSEGVEWSLFSVWGLTISMALGGAIGGIMADALGIKFTFVMAGILNFLAILLVVSLYSSLDGSKKKALPPQIPLP